MAECQCKEEDDATASLVDHGCAAQALRMPLSTLAYATPRTLQGRV